MDHPPSELRIGKRPVCPRCPCVALASHSRAAVEEPVWKGLGMSESEKSPARGNIRLGWIGLITYVLIALNSIRLLGDIPYQYFILGSLINGTILTLLVLYLRRAYRKKHAGGPGERSG